MVLRGWPRERWVEQELLTELEYNAIRSLVSYEKGFEHEAVVQDLDIRDWLVGQHQ